VRRSLALLVASVLSAGVVLATASADGETCQAEMIDDAALLTPSTRLDGALEALRRDGVVVLVRTVATGASANERALDVAARCPDLGSPDGDAVIVVVGARNRDVDVLPIGTTRPQDAQVAHGMIAGRLDRGDTDVTSAVAQGLEALWQAPAAPGRPADVDPRPTTGNHWARARSRRIATAAIGTGTATAPAVLLLTEGRRRRRRVADARAEAQRCRTALAERYVDFDAAVIRAAAADDASSPKLPRAAATAVAAAGQRATQALLASAESPRRHVAEAQSLAATCRAAEEALREAVAAIGETSTWTAGTPEAQQGSSWPASGSAESSPAPSTNGSRPSGKTTA
jgi:hypothetical protein